MAAQHNRNQNHQSSHRILVSRRFLEVWLDVHVLAEELLPSQSSRLSRMHVRPLKCDADLA